MKHIFKITTYSLFIALTLGSSNIFCMDWIRSWCGCKRAKTGEISESKMQELLSTELAIHDKKKLYTLLYDLITTMPPELIRIILDYDSYELKGISRNSLSGEFRAHPNSLVELPNEIVTVQEKSDNMNYWDIKTNTITETIKSNDAKLLSQIEDIRASVLQMTSQRAIGIDYGEIGLLDTTNHNNPVSKIIRKNVNDETILSLTKLSENVFVAIIQHMQNSSIKRNIELWDINNERCFFIASHNSADNLIRLSENTFAITTRRSDQSESFIEIWYWDQTSARCIKTIKVGQYEIRALAKLSNGYLAAGFKIWFTDMLNKGLIKVFDPISGECKNQFGQNTDSAGAKYGFDDVRSLCSLSNGHLASLSYDYDTNIGTLTHWE